MSTPKVKPNMFIDAIAGASCVFGKHKLCEAFGRYRLGGLTKEEARAAVEKYKAERSRMLNELRDSLDTVKKRLQEISDIRFHEARNF